MEELAKLPSSLDASRVFGLFVAMLVVQRLAELRLARKHTTLALEAGAKEYGAEHYRWFFPLHIGWAVAWIFEATREGLALSDYSAVFVLLFLLAQGLRYWAISSLGERWNTRIFIWPDRPPVQSGLYRWLRHPNYYAVVIELAVVPLLFGAWRSALLFGLLNLALLWGVRIPCEERALAGRSKASA